MSDSKPLLLEACVYQNAALRWGERTLDPTPGVLTPRLWGEAASVCIFSQPFFWMLVTHCRAWRGGLEKYCPVLCINADSGPELSF